VEGSHRGVEGGSQGRGRELHGSWGIHRGLTWAWWGVDMVKMHCSGP
jgi:hypothetical protein